MIKNRIIYGAFVLIFAALFIICNTRAALAAAVIVTALPPVMGIYLIVYVKKLKISCQMPGRSETGKEIYALLTIESPLKIAPGEISLTGTIYNRLFGEKTKNSFLIDLSGGGGTIEIPFSSKICGSTELRLGDLICYDFFHIFRMRLSYSFCREIAVYPAKISLTAGLRSFSSRERDGRAYDMYKRGNDTAEILEIREYRPGDNVKNIHWKLSSKHNRILLKEFSRPNNLSTIIYCDTSFYAGGQELSNEAVSDIIAVAAAISRSLILRGTEHSFCFPAFDGYRLITVESMNDYKRLLSDIIGSALSRKHSAAEAATQPAALYEGISKIVYVTSQYDDINFRMISGNSELSAVIVNPGGHNTYNTNESYEIIAISSDDLYEQSHNILL